MAADNRDVQSTLSSLASDDESERGISEGVTSDSGLSDEMGGGGNSATRLARRLGTDRRTAKASTALAVKFPAICPMCEIRPTRYLAIDSGRLCLCLECCVNLHDNRFLSQHKIQDLQTGAIVTVQNLKDLQAELKSADNISKSRAAATAEREAEIAAEMEASTSVASPLGRAELVEQDDPESFDLAALAADQNVIQARLKELTHCADLLKKLGIELTQEMESSREATSTAVEAVKRKFDILRTVLNAKEEEFISVVQEAGKSRLEAATKGQTEANVIISELQGFVAHTDNQLDRLRGNSKLFSTSRRPMLETSEKKLNEADNSIHNLQDRLDSVRHQSLGMQISMEDPVEAIQRLKPPTTLTQRAFDPPHTEAIQSTTFVTSPGVKTFTQDRAVPRGAAEVVDAAPIVAAEPTIAATRQSFDKEVNKLRQSPLPNRATGRDSPARRAPAHSNSFAAEDKEIRVAQARQAQQQPKAATSSSLIQRTAARRQTSPGRAGRSSIFPPELEALRKQVSGNQQLVGSAAARGGAANSRTMSPIRPGGAGAAATGSSRINGTPTRGTPSRRTDSPSRAGGAGAGGNRAYERATTVSSRASFDGNNPGPGSYQVQSSFGSRGVLSTPPRRR